MFLKSNTEMYYYHPKSNNDPIMCKIINRTLAEVGYFFFSIMKYIYIFFFSFSFYLLSDLQLAFLDHNPLVTKNIGHC